MAEIVYRANLSSKSIPFLSFQQGRTVIVKQNDHNYVPNVTAKQDDDKDIGIPQVYFMENVMPTEYGYQSVGFSDLIPGINASFIESFTFVQDGTNYQFGFTATGAVYILSKELTNWLAVNVDPLIDLSNNTITHATVSGTTYFYAYPAAKCFKYNKLTNTLDEVTLTGLSGTVLGIVSAYGYLIAYTKDQVAWSSTIDPTDFVPSLTTGAGGGSVEGAKGYITACIPLSQGFLVFTDQNCVGARASNNSRYPFVFNEIIGAGGLTDINLISTDGDVGSIYAYTTSGLQLISLVKATQAFPALTDFMAGKTIEVFDRDLNTFVIYETSTALLKRLTTISDRFFVFSYGIDSIQYAVVFDTALGKWGKLKQDHIAAFEFRLWTTAEKEVVKDSFVLMDTTGKITFVDLNNQTGGAAGVILFGKYQYIRQRMVTLQRVELEVIKQAADTEVLCLMSLDGKNFEPAVSGYLHQSGELSREYLFNETGKNASVLVKGQFNLDSAVLTFTVHGHY